MAHSLGTTNLANDYNIFEVFHGKLHPTIALEALLANVMPLASY